MHDYREELNEILNNNILANVKSNGTSEDRTVVANLIKAYRKAIRQTRILDNLKFFDILCLTNTHYYMNDDHMMLDLTDDHHLWELGSFWIKFKIYVKKCENDYYFSKIVPYNIKSKKPFTQFSKSYKEGYHTVSEKKLLEIVTERLTRYKVEVIID